jgi:drug/metabolite transporter (DMT)-like permease
MQLARVTDRRRVFHLDRGSLLAILAGLLLVLASFLLKDANTELATLNPRVGAGRFEVAGHTLFNVTWMEVLLLTVWLVLRAPQQLSLVEVHWRRMLLIGLTGFLGSLGWFWAYSLTLVAYVKAVGQIEAVAAVGYALFIFKEREVLRQLPGMALVIVGILVVLVSQ